MGFCSNPHDYRKHFEKPKEAALSYARGVAVAAGYKPSEIKDCISNDDPILVSYFSVKIDKDKSASGHEENVQVSLGFNQDRSVLMYATGEEKGMRYETLLNLYEIERSVLGAIGKYVKSEKT